MEYTRQFIGQKEKKQKDDFIAKIQELILRDPEVSLVEQLDYQEFDGFRRWFFFTPKFSPSGFVELTETGTLVQGCNSLKPSWIITIET